MSELEALRMLMAKRGNIQDELSKIGEEAGEGTEIQTVTLFKLMKAFEKVAQRFMKKETSLYIPLFNMTTQWKAAGNICWIL